MYDQSAPTSIKGFFGEYRWLSNFWFAPVKYKGHLYPSSEHAYHAGKQISEENRLLFLTGSMQQVKWLGGAGGGLPLRPDWEQKGESDMLVKDEVMLEILLIKFHIPEYREKLLATGKAYLEETNTWRDEYWGVCRGKGKNMLGILLMKVRDILHLEEEADIGALQEPPQVLNMRHFRNRPLPDNAVLVDRTTKWGNPFKVGRDAKTNEEAVKLFDEYLDKHPELKAAAKRELKGKDLVCWCFPKDCHACTWLRVAND